MLRKTLHNIFIYCAALLFSLPLFSIQQAYFVSPAEIAGLLYGAKVGSAEQSAYADFSAHIEDLEFQKAETILIENLEVPGFRLNLALLYYHAGAENVASDAARALLNSVTDKQLESILILLAKKGRHAEISFFCEATRYIPAACSINLLGVGRKYPAVGNYEEMTSFLAMLQQGKAEISHPELSLITGKPSGKSWLIRMLVYESEYDLAEQFFNFWGFDKQRDFQSVLESYTLRAEKKQSRRTILLTVD